MALSHNAAAFTTFHSITLFFSGDTAGLLSPLEPVATEVAVFGLGAVLVVDIRKVDSDGK